MQITQNSLLRSVIRFILLMLLFHFLWLIFYYLSNSGLLDKELRGIFFKQLFVNTTGFIAFYMGAYWLFPAFISKQKYLWLAILLIGFSIGLGKLQYLLQDWQLDPSFPFMQQEAQAVSLPPGSHITSQAVQMTQTVGSDVRAMFNIFIFFLFGIGFAYAKDWFVKDRRARILEKEKLQSELALLRYQLNPHFLFNTINDIYYLSLIKSDTTPDALLQLSNILRYVLNEKEEWVSLSKELEYLQQFIQLHKFRFPDEVVTQHTELNGNTNKLQIAPLLLITFVENAFKHGEPGTEENPVSIHLSLQDGMLNYEVSNQLPANISKDESSGIGISNLKRRLSLLYPNVHQLSFVQEDNRFIATLKLDLQHDTKLSHR